MWTCFNAINSSSVLPNIHEIKNINYVTLESLFTRFGDNEVSFIHLRVMRFIELKLNPVEKGKNTFLKTRIGGSTVYHTIPILPNAFTW